MKRAPVRTVLGVILQLTALTLVLLSVFLPRPGTDRSSGTVSSVCMGDHALCGCAPERVTMRNCCCFPSEASCCDSGGQEADEGGKDAVNSRPGLYAAPCGDGPKYLDPLSAKIDLALPLAPKVFGGGWQVLSYPLRFFDSPSSRFPEPPDPPPKIASIA